MNGQRTLILTGTIRHRHHSRSRTWWPIFGYWKVCTNNPTRNPQVSSRPYTLSCLQRLSRRSGSRAWNRIYIVVTFIKDMYGTNWVRTRNFVKPNVPQEMRRLGQRRVLRHRQRGLLPQMVHKPLSSAMINGHNRRTFRRAHTQLEGLFLVLRSGREWTYVIRVSWW